MNYFKEHNRLSNDLRFDVGIDGELAKRSGGFISGVPFMCPMLAH